MIFILKNELKILLDLIIFIYLFRINKIKNS
jgi:hypothetical protein